MMKVLKCKNCNHAIIKVWSTELTRYICLHKNISINETNTTCMVKKCKCKKAEEDEKDV